MTKRTDKVLEAFRLKSYSTRPKYLATELRTISGGNVGKDSGDHVTHGAILQLASCRGSLTSPTRDWAGPEGP